MSRLSDIWHGIRSGFDINKMKRDPLGSAAKLAAIYGIGSTAVGAFAPEFAQRAGDWMKRGFGIYDDPVGRSGQGYFDKRGKLDLAIKAPPRGGFLERQIKGIGEFAAKPFDFGMDLKKWYNGDKSWNQIKQDNFGWLNTKSAGEAASLWKNSRGGPGGGPGGGRGKPEHRQFSRGMPAGAAQISQARQGGMYKPGGISQALITGGITPETLAMLGYGSGQVTGAQERSIDLEDVGTIKTTLRSAVG